MIPYEDWARLWEMRGFAREVASILDGAALDEYPRSLAQQRALERSLMLIGEAARAVSEETRQALADVAWKRIIGLRHVIAHDYRGLQQDRLWRVASTDVPALVLRLDALLPPEPSSE
jgi:uncharacterized protein with HEPN domain